MQFWIFGMIFCIILTIYLHKLYIRVKISRNNFCMIVYSDQLHVIYDRHFFVFYFIEITHTIIIVNTYLCYMIQ